MLLIQLITLFGVMFVFLLLRFPVYYSIGAAAIVFAIVYPGTVPTEVIGQGFIQGVNKNTFVAIIFYFLLGEIMNSGGITDRLLRFAQAAMGHVTGALSHINIIASVIFAGVSGSAAADTACIGSMMIPMMIKQGYPPRIRGGYHTVLGHHRTNHSSVCCYRPHSHIYECFCP